MFKVLFSLMVIAVIAIPLPADAQRAVQTRAWIVGTHLSEPGETKEAFVRRIAPIMEAWTTQTGNEVCGVLATDGQNWGVKLTTQRSQVMCFFAATVLPEGMQATTDTIHTHPVPPEGSTHLLITDETMESLRMVRDRVMVKRINEGHRRLRVQVQGFSPDDYAAGPGYLIVGGRLLYQDGPGVSNDLGHIH